MKSLSSVAKAFTIVELVIVVVAIGILAGIVTVAYRGVALNSERVALHAELKGATGPIARYKAKNGSYPSQGSFSRDFRY